MPNTKSAIKRLRQADKRRLRNRIYLSRARTSIKKTNRLIAEDRLDEARQVALEAVSALDQAAGKGVIHKNNAARRKSRLLRRLNQALAGPEAE